ncbi:lantibiotic protection ABC transporter ATP-binding protein [Bacillus xiapuensis]|uniref:lantibiotic protection ABC transporter ATP-binding protein n=1 Tax=Bacillus xiapuensis TaxID=2014075 RepID=UPI000C242AE0|nr:lantibiotic protection ABC transporter ATP-binding protein [Bacillus xiapuensis]
MSDYILEVKGLTKKFKNQIAVNNVSLSIRKNSVYGLLGPNGAGKSTILKMITGIMKPSSGEILFENHLWTRKDLNDIGALIENPAIYPNLTARENLNVACTLHGLPKSRAEEVLNIVDLEKSGKKKVKNFSMGMKQRLGLAIAIIHNPKLLILDEPTNGLDPIGIEELRELIKTFPSKGITVILSSHILSEVAQVADEIGIISDGIIGYNGKINHEDNLEKLFMEIVERNRGINQ